jgi:glucose/arabinose dehydrogenase
MWASGRRAWRGAGARETVRTMRRAAAPAVLLVCVAACGGAGSGKPTATPAGHGGSAAVGSAERAVGGAAVVARGIPFATNLAFDGRGRLWVSSGAGGANPSDGIWYVPPEGPARHVAKGLTAAFGLTWLGDRLYVAHIVSPTSGAITELAGFTGTGFKRRRVVLRGIPVGNHTLGSIVVGPHGRLFFGAGAARDKAGPTGRVESFTPGEARPRVEATGLNSAYGLAFAGSRVLVTDDGRDDLGPNRPPDEVDAFDPAGPVVDFGYPACYGQGGRPCAGTRKPLVSLPAHASPAGTAVRGHFTYVADNGSLLPKHPTGNDVQRVDLRTGRRTVFWRSPVKHDPTGLAIGPDGDLYLALYASGKVVRFAL